MLKLAHSPFQSKPQNNAHVLMTVQPGKESTSVLPNVLQDDLYVIKGPRSCCRGHVEVMQLSLKDLLLCFDSPVVGKGYASKDNKNVLKSINFMTTHSPCKMVIHFKMK